MRFTAEWCQPCKSLEAKLASLKLDLPIVDIDTEVGKDLCTFYGIRSVPTIVIDYGPGDVTKFMGAALSDHAIAKIQDALDL